MNSRSAPERLVTDRLELRQFDGGDLEAYALMSADPQVMRFIGTGETFGTDVAWRGIAGMLGHWRLLGHGQWAVTRRSDGMLLGRAGFIHPYGWPGFELGYMFAREHWGQGYAREACSAALRVARDVLGKDRIISLIRPANAPSIKLAQFLGARFESSIEFLGGEARVYAYPPR